MFCRGRIGGRLRQVITAGETLRLGGAVDAFFAAHPECELHNHYGPTEAHVVTAHVVTAQLVTAFGQTCAYCLFSHKSYLVAPKAAPQDEVARLDSLCQIFGIGLVLFNAEDATSPQFEIRVRPRKLDPDLFFANKYMKLIEPQLF